MTPSYAVSLKMTIRRYSKSSILGKKSKSYYNVARTPRDPARYACMTWSSTKELLSHFENPEQKFRSKRRLFDTPSLIESSSPEFDHSFDIEEQSGEDGETMAETME
ncbi:hypothetical protein Tco_0412491 [Tanacetum coccineum]